MLVQQAFNEIISQLSTKPEADKWDKMISSKYLEEIKYFISQSSAASVKLCKRHPVAGSPDLVAIVFRQCKAFQQFQEFFF